MAWLYVHASGTTPKAGEQASSIPSTGSRSAPEPEGSSLACTSPSPAIALCVTSSGKAYAAAALVARMEDEALDRAPVWDDLKTFRGRDWRGVVDLLTAGYPCQPFSAAGKRLGTADPRHLWPHVRRIIVQVRPRRVFLENVGGHLSLGFDIVHRELSQLGFTVAARLQSAAETGARHERERLFILADAGYGVEWRQQPTRSTQGGWSEPERGVAVVADADAARWLRRQRIALSMLSWSYEPAPVWSETSQQYVTEPEMRQLELL